jgi:mono/diheme cytochrome c family protein
MIQLHDILIAPPIPKHLSDWLLFFTFVLHFIFVLFTIGTAVIGVSRLGHRVFSRTAEIEETPILKSLFIHKSLAITIGVSVLLLMMVSHSVPFILAANLNAPYWMLITTFLIVSLIILELIAEKKKKPGYISFFLAVIGLGVLLAVPGTFVAVVSTAEQPEHWPEVFTGSGMTAAMAVHWLMRWLHVIGAAVVFTAGFRWIRLDTEKTDERRHHETWMLGGLAFQFPAGVALFATLPRWPGVTETIIVVVGIAAAIALMWVVLRIGRSGVIPRWSLVLTLLTLILLPMLMTRQILQDRALLPVSRQLQQNAKEYRSMLVEANAEPVLRDPVTTIAPRTDPAVIYFKSCAVCHGAVGNGQGDALPMLTVPPEDLTATRATTDSLRDILRTGVDGTSMLRFGFYTQSDITGLIRFLREQIDLQKTPAPLNREISVVAARRGDQAFEEHCKVCHSLDGPPTEIGSRLLPPSPDLSQITFSAQYIFNVLRDGYPGTMMNSFRELPEDTRWALVKKVHSIYQKPSTQPAE